jgi:hypothetical protein
VPSLPPAPANADVIDGLLAEMNKELNRRFVHEPKELRDEDLPLMPPACPEMVYQRYIAEKNAWLKQHPYTKESHYQRARGWEIYRPRWLKWEAVTALGLLHD